MSTLLKIKCQGCGLTFQALTVDGQKECFDTWYAHSMSCPGLAKQRDKETMSKLKQFFSSMFLAIRKPCAIAFSWTETKVWTVIFHVDNAWTKVRSALSRKR